MNPYSGLTESDGFLYGTTQRGGSIEQTGTLFRIKPDGSGFTKLHDFDGINGRNPHGEVINVNEVLYGMTTKGGSRDLGIVYRMNTDGTGFKKLHDFTGPDGANPSGALVHDASGNLYGMTSNGGSDNSGVIFKIANTGTGFTKLFDLSATAGAHPNGSLVIREDTFSPPAAVVSAFRPEADLGVTIHPNPSTDHFTIQVKSNAGEAIRIMVTDPYGQPVTTYEIEPDTPIQIGGELKRGIYIMKIMQGKQVVLQRMVKK
jgi:uncharacterized repeat protein (TIGR03803 family)